jgi:hypothetical protein
LCLRVLSCLVFSFLVLCLVLSCGCLVLSCGCVALCYLVFSGLVVALCFLSCLVLYCLALSFPCLVSLPYCLVVLPLLQLSAPPPLFFPLSDKFTNSRFLFSFLFFHEALRDVTRFALALSLCDRERAETRFDMSTPNDATLASMAPPPVPSKPKTLQGSGASNPALSSENKKIPPTPPVRSYPPLIRTYQEGKENGKLVLVTCYLACLVLFCLVLVTSFTASEVRMQW